jgi:hypothetical protein
MSFFIDKECGTGYGPLTESLFTFCKLLQSPCLESPLQCCEWEIPVRGELFIYWKPINLP